MMERENSKLNEIVEIVERVGKDWPTDELMHSFGVAVAKAVVALAADTIENGKVWYEHPDDCRTRCQHTLMEASKAIRALAADPSGEGRWP